MKKYSTGAVIRQTLIVILTVTTVAIWGTAIYLHVNRPVPEMGVDWFPFTNIHVSMDYAGCGGGGK